MVMVSKFGPMDLNMMVSGKTIKLMEMENLFMLMGMYMMDNGRMIKHMGWDITCMQMERLIMEIGKMISNMERVLRLGLMELGTKALTLKARNMEKELFVLQMGVFILATFNIMKYQGEVNMYGPMESHMKDNGKRIKCMATEYLLGKIKRDMRVIL
jgi:hypothetical protein